MWSPFNCLLEHLAFSWLHSLNVLSGGQRGFTFITADNIQQRLKRKRYQFLYKSCFNRFEQNTQGCVFQRSSKHVIVINVAFLIPPPTLRTQVQFFSFIIRPKNSVGIWRIKCVFTSWPWTVCTSPKASSFSFLLFANTSNGQMCHLTFFLLFLFLAPGFHIKKRAPSTSNRDISILL